MAAIEIKQPKVVLSIVSHGQLPLIKNLLLDVREHIPEYSSIILTINIPEDESILPEFVDMPILVLRNPVPMGFGENHNQAFNRVVSDFFLILNPDIRLREFSMHALLENFCFADVGAIAPVVINPAGHVEDSVRKFPTFLKLLQRWMLGEKGSDYQWSKSPIEVDWVAGMFVAYRSIAFKEVGGFDTRYFMYMEDADICQRLSYRGWRSILEPSTSVIHDAQRASHRNLKHFSWHFKSVLRFLFLSSRN